MNDFSNIKNNPSPAAINEQWKSITVARAQKNASVNVLVGGALAFVASAGALVVMQDPATAFHTAATALKNASVLAVVVSAPVYVYAISKKQKLENEFVQAFGTTEQKSQGQKLAEQQTFNEKREKMMFVLTVAASLASAKLATWVTGNPAMATPAGLAASMAVTSTFSKFIDKLHTERNTSAYLADDVMLKKSPSAPKL